MPRHTETFWTILLTSPDGKRSFLAVLDSIVTRPTQRKCKDVLRLWREISNSPRAGQVVKVRVEVVGE